MKSKTFNFKIISKDKRTRARAGVVSTPHGEIETPAFIPVGTRATVRSLSPNDLKEIGVQIVFGNTYHLHLRPGEETVKEFGGLAKFMSWNGPTITDSGGFQVFSLIHRARVNNSENFGSFSHVANDARSSHSKLSTQTRSLSENRPQTNSSLEENPLSVFSSFASEKTSSVEASKEISFSEDPHVDLQEAEAKLMKITDDGATFRSHIDGSLHTFTPEKSIEIQQKLGADIILAFDECAPYPFTHEGTKKAMERTHDWAKRCLKASKNKSEILSSKLETNPNDQNSNKKNVYDFKHSNLNIVSDFDIRASNFSQALYGIMHGGVYKDLREESAKFISSLLFDGIAIGGVSVGETKKEMKEAVDWVIPYLPEEKPKHLLGIGEIDDIFDGVERGMDTFDCVIPTRFGRYGIAFVAPSESEEKGKYRINLPKTKYAKDKGPISKNCKCSTCQNFTRGYIHHLFRSDELLGYRLVSYHNVYFIINLVKQIRQSILEDRFQKLKKEWI